jgi:hypothetical protein
VFKISVVESAIKRLWKSNAELVLKMLFCVYPIDGWFAIKNSYNLTIPMKQEKESKRIRHENTKGKKHEIKPNSFRD